MGRIISLWPEFWTSSDMLRLSEREHRAYGVLLSAADALGRVSLCPFKLKREGFSVYPPTVEDCEAYIETLTTRGFVDGYGARGKRYGVIRGYSGHVKPNIEKIRPGGSWCPAPPEAIALANPDYCWGVERAIRFATLRRKSEAVDNLVDILWPYDCVIPATELTDVRRVAFVEGPGYCVATTGVPRGNPVGTPVVTTRSPREETAAPPETDADPHAADLGAPSDALEPGLPCGDHGGTMWTPKSNTEEAEDAGEAEDADPTPLSPPAPEADPGPTPEPEDRSGPAPTVERTLGSILDGMKPPQRPRQNKPEDQRRKLDEWTRARGLDAPQGK